MIIIGRIKSNLMQLSHKALYNNKFPEYIYLNFLHVLRMPIIYYPPALQSLRFQDKQELLTTWQ